MSRLRVALLGEYPVREDAIHGGGVQSVTHVLAHALARRDDVECHVVCATRNPSEPYRRVGDLHVHFLARLPLPRLATSRAHDVPRLLRAVRAIDPDVVHGQGQDRHGLAAVRCGRPAVVTPHGVIFVESALLKRHALDAAGAVRKALLDRTEREIFRRATDMIVISHYLTSIYGGLLTARAHYVENPIEERFFRIERRPERGRLLFAGTVVPRKRVGDLVAAVALLKARPGAAGAQPAPAWLANLRLRIVGPQVDPVSAAQVRGLISEHDLADTVVLTGAVGQEELLDEYARAELLVLSSREETAPQIIAQAMACGLPVVSSAAGGVPHMVRDGETAALFPVGDVAVCAQKIQRLLEDDPGRAAMSARIAAAARERFHPDAVAEKTVAVYREVLERTRAPLNAPAAPFGFPPSPPR
jgi:glycosyltransferase involved in cell wall biosynthesis